MHPASLSCRSQGSMLADTYGRPQQVGCSIRQRTKGMWWSFPPPCFLGIDRPLHTFTDTSHTADSNATEKEVQLKDNVGQADGTYFHVSLTLFTHTH
jgi:hypothetical protein